MNTNANNKRSNILLIEDNPINIVVIKKILGAFYDVDTITSGRKLQAMLENSDYQLILTDMNLGDDDMNGFDVMQQVRNNPKTAHLPIVVVTAYTLADDIEKFKLQGFTDFIPKPVNKEFLLHVMGKYLA